MARLLYHCPDYLSKVCGIIVYKIRVHEMHGQPFPEEDFVALVRSAMYLLSPEMEDEASYSVKPCGQIQRRDEAVHWMQKELGGELPWWGMNDIEGLSGPSFFY